MQELQTSFISHGEAAGRIVEVSDHDLFNRKNELQAALIAHLLNKGYQQKTILKWIERFGQDMSTLVNDFYSCDNKQLIQMCLDRYGFPGSVGEVNQNYQAYLDQHTESHGTSQKV